MTYSIKEMFYTLQGEGFHTGRPAVFCRFTGCNLWNGREQDRASSICQFCDTDFIGTDGNGGGKFKTSESLALEIANLWPDQQSNRFVVLTGGEPGLQLDTDLIDALQAEGFECAVESNGTVPLPQNLDWVCISPKGESQVVIDRCDELKLVYPQSKALPERFNSIDAQYRYLSPKNNWQESSLTPTNNPFTLATIEYCLENPKWRLTLQSHKILQIE